MWRGAQRWSRRKRARASNSLICALTRSGAATIPIAVARTDHLSRSGGGPILIAMSSGSDRVARFMSSLEGEVREVAPGEWGLTLDAAGYVLDVGVAIRGSLLRAQAAVLPAGLIDPHQLLYWNRQAPLVCFAENRAGEVFVCGELALESLDTEMLDRFLGLLLASATRAREFAIQNA
jgi:hypothetical protein